MKIGIIRETKNPVDNRVCLTPRQCSELNQLYPNHEIVVQTSDVRAYSDEEYRALGVRVLDDLSDCDILMGIKEAHIESLLPRKHYFFFGHIAKMQEYNRPLIQSMIANGLTFTDYEYIVDDSKQRLCAFGWWAGVVGTYYSLMGYGLRHNKYFLPKPDLSFTLERLLDNLKKIQLPAIKVLISGTGRVAKGAQFVMDALGAKMVGEHEYLSSPNVTMLTYTIAGADKLVKRKDGRTYSRQDFAENPCDFESDFMRWAYQTDMFISAHYWDSKAPVYLDVNNLSDPNLRIKFIGDITCDILGSIKSTLRSSTHAEPFYDYNPITGKENAPFSSSRNITVMAVDTCPNALALDTSEYFGKMLIEHIFTPMFRGEKLPAMERATIIRDGKLTNGFSYLADFASGK